LIRFGRETFEEAAKISRYAEGDSNQIDWTRLQFMVFDMPGHQGTYAERYHLLGTKYFLFILFI